MPNMAVAMVTGKGLAGRVIIEEVGNGGLWKRKWWVVGGRDIEHGWKMN